MSYPKQMTFLVLWLIAAIAFSTIVQPIHAQLPDRPQPGIPVRPPTPVPPPLPEDQDKQGAHIVLTLSPSQQAYWTEVEWVDSNGDWHVVEGWRGYTSNGWIRWFVAEPELGRGPFRWQVYSQQSLLLAGSKPFHLPTKKDAIVEVRLTFVD